MNSVIFYYMEGCPWCVKFYSEWDKFEKLAKTNGFTAKKIERAELNSNNLIGGNIQGFPTIRVQNAKGEVFDYSGNRTANDLLTFAKTHAVIQQQNGGGVVNSNTSKQSKYKNALRQLYTYKVNKYNQKLEKLNEQ